MPASTLVTITARAVGTPAAAMTSLEKALLPSSRAAAAPGPKARMPAARSASHIPDDQGRLGPDHHQVGPEGARQRHHPARVRQVDGDHLGVAADARVASGADDPGSLGGSSERPHESVLAASASHHQDRAAHAGTLAHAAVGGAVATRPPIACRAMAQYSRPPLSRAEREAHRAMLEEALARLPTPDDPERSASEVMRALDAYLEATGSRHRPDARASPRSPTTPGAASTTSCGG